MLEDCLEQLFATRASRTSDPQVVSFVRQTMDRSFRNPEFQKVRTFIGLFDPALSNALAQGLDDRYKEALTFIVEKKNRLAHGKNPQFTVADLTTYYIRARRVVQAVEALPV